MSAELETSIYKCQLLSMPTGSSWKTNSTNDVGRFLFESFCPPVDIWLAYF